MELARVEAEPACRLSFQQPLGMNDRLRELEVEHTAEHVITELGMRDLPICPRTICKRNGILVRSRESSPLKPEGFGPNGP